MLILFSENKVSQYLCFGCRFALLTIRRKDKLLANILGVRFMSFLENGSFFFCFLRENARTSFETHGSLFINCFVILIVWNENTLSKAILNVSLILYNIDHIDYQILTALTPFASYSHQLILSLDKYGWSSVPFFSEFLIASILFTLSTS